MQGWRQGVPCSLLAKSVSTSLLLNSGNVAAPFAGNVPMFDLLVADVDGFAFPVQVKTIRSGSWQFNLETFLNIEIVDGKQFVRGTAPLANPDLVCVFVLIKDGGRDEFYVFRFQD